jgi:hypothetical protein
VDEKVFCIHGGPSPELKDMQQIMAKLNEREQELARQLVKRGVLIRRSIDDRIVFEYNSAEQLGDIL